MSDQALAALRELTEAVMAEFFGNDTNLSKRLIKATNDAQLLLMVQPPDDDRVNRPAPAEPADMAVEQLQHIIHRKPWATWLRPGGCLESAHCELTDLLSSVIAADRARRAALPAEGELVDLADAVMPWAARLDEGTPEERLLGRVSAVLRQRQAPPNEGEVDALIKILSRIARMLDFMPDGPPKGLIIHRAIELLRQLAPPAEGEVGELVAWIYRQATHGPDGDKWRRTANLLQRQAAELAMLRGERPHG